MERIAARKKLYIYMVDVNMYSLVMLRSSTHAVVGGIPQGFGSTAI